MLSGTRLKLLPKLHFVMRAS